MPKLTINHNCKNCDFQFEIEVDCTPSVPAQVSGPPESCYPAEGGEIEITDNDACPQCNTEVNVEDITDKVYEYLADDYGSEPED